MNYRTRQEIFDLVVAHLRKQGHAARDEKGFARYIVANGDRCAIGCLMSKSAAKHHGALCADHPQVLGTTRIRREDAMLALALQEAHDHSEPGEWESLFEKIAKRFGLTYSEVSP